MLDFVSELRALDDPLAFPPRVLRRLLELVPVFGATYSVLDPTQQESVLQVFQWHDGEEVVDWSPTAASQSFWELRHTHPSCDYRTASGDWTSPRKVSDFLTLREFRRTPIYQASYEGRTSYWLDVGLSPVGDETHMFIFTRYKQADFDERDRLMLMLLQPFLQLRASEAETASRAVAALATVEENASDGGIPESYPARTAASSSSPRPPRELSLLATSSLRTDVSLRGSSQERTRARAEHESANDPDRTHRKPSRAVAQ